MGLRSWVVGILLGLIAGGAALVAGVLALILLVPVLVWAARESARPCGIGGLLIGLGAGGAGLLALANARCSGSTVSGPNYLSECVAPDLTPLFGAAAVLMTIGVVLSVLGIARR